MKMRGDMDLPGDGPFGFVGGAGGGASKFPLPGSDERWLSLSRGRDFSMLSCLNDDATRDPISAY